MEESTLDFLPDGSSLSPYHEVDLVDAGVEIGVIKYSNMQTALTWK